MPGVMAVPGALSAPSVMSAPGVIPLPRYEEGVWKVPKTEPAVIHEGELVIPRDLAEHVRTASTSAPLSAETEAFRTEDLARRQSRSGLVGLGLDAGQIETLARSDARRSIESGRLSSPRELAGLGLSGEEMASLASGSARRALGMDMPKPPAFDIGRWAGPTWSEKGGLVAGKMVSATERLSGSDLVEATRSAGIPTSLGPKFTANLTTHTDMLSQGYATAIQTAEKEMKGFESRMSARLKSMNTQIRDHMIAVIKQELPSILQQQGARR